MKLRTKTAILLILISWLPLICTANSAAIDFTGKFSVWDKVFREENDWRMGAGARYMPCLSGAIDLDDGTLVDAELSFNLLLNRSLTGDIDARAELYRAKLRYATPKTETRIGLQRINFGPARLLRALSWFDRLDPRDPIQLVEGVNGLRFKYSAENNASIWFWALYGNDTKGYEVFPTKSGKPEFGARVQFPVPRGELAFTGHHRTVDVTPDGGHSFREARIGIDGRWDVGIGLWFETSVQNQEIESIPYRWIQMATLGGDYTIGLGNGVYVLFEQMFSCASENLLSFDSTVAISAISVSYPLGLLDNISMIGYYVHEADFHSFYVGWQRNYDNLTINLGGFHNSQVDLDNVNIGGIGDVSSGIGVELLIACYH